MEIIKTENLTFTYPNCEKSALDNINLTINSGEFITVCGKSGCGKSTLLRQLKPILAPHGQRLGMIYFKNTDIFTLSQKEQSAKIGYVMQSPENQIVTDKVWHELAFGLESLGFKNNEIRAKVAEMASFFGISDWFYKNTEDLSGGQKQLLNLASVMVCDPEVLILDEPTSQLDPIAASDFLETLHKINREIGTTVILSEHRLEDAIPMSDRVIVMDKGKIIADSAPIETANELRKINHDMIKALPTPMRVYFGVKNNEVCPLTVRDGKQWLDKMSKQKPLNENYIQDFTEKPFSDNAVVLDDVWFRYEKNEPDIIKGLSLTVKKGEFYAILGGNGVGKTTTLSLINSSLKMYRGKKQISGKIAMLPQNPQYLFVKKTVYEDLLEVLAGKTKESREDKLQNIIDICDLNHLTDKHPYDLSGGEQQRAALAKVLLNNPDILLLDEPTKGFDADFKEKFAELIKTLTQNGITVISVSHDIEFCGKYADRCAMFFDGKIVSEANPKEFFAGKSFYTTASNRMARNHLPKAILAEDIIRALGEKAEFENPKSPPKKILLKSETEKKEKKTKKISLQRIITGCLFSIITLIIFLLKDLIIKHINDIMYSTVILLFAFVSALSFFPQKEIGIKENKPKREKLKKRTLISLLLVFITIPITILIGVTLLHDRKYYFISLLIILQVFLPFLLIFEEKSPQARELIIISVMCAIAVIGRVAFATVPQFKPITALIIISGIAFGGEAGFLIGAVSGFVSNFFFSQGPLTPWQMFAFGIIGFLAGLMFGPGKLKKTKISLCIFGGISSILIYGGIMNPASVITYTTPTKDLIISAYALGLPYDIIHGLSTVFFLWILAEPMLLKLDRIKIKYGLIKN